MKKLGLVFLSLSLLTQTRAQVTTAPGNESLQKTNKDSLRMALFFSKATYPLIKSSKWAGVLPVSHITEKPNPNLTYKLLMEDVFPVKDSADAREINRGMAEIGRLLNLHLASGIPRNKLKLIAVVHGPALYALYNNTAYHKKYGVDNPNIVLVNELIKNGVKFIACGQAMQIFGVPEEEMIPGIKISLTAQTVLSQYQTEGFVLFSIQDQK